MRVYVALFDLQGNFLVGQKRMTSRWWGGKTTPASSILDEAGRFCFPSGEIKYFDTTITAAERVFYEQTGHEIPAIHYCAVNTRIDGCALVGFTTRGIQPAHDAINKGFVPRLLNRAAPANGYIVDWELERVMMVKADKLHSYLGLLQEAGDAKPGFSNIKNDGVSETRRRYLKIAEYLRTKT